MGVTLLPKCSKSKILAHTLHMWPSVFNKGMGVPGQARIGPAFSQRRFTFAIARMPAKLGEQKGTNKHAVARRCDFIHVCAESDTPSPKLSVQNLRKPWTLYNILQIYKPWDNLLRISRLVPTASRSLRCRILP